MQRELSQNTNSRKYRIASIGRMIIPLLILAALVSVPLLTNVVLPRQPSFAELERQSVQLAGFLQNHIEKLSLGVDPAYAQEQHIELTGPPDNSLFELLEPVTVHWSDSRSLASYQTYVVAIAYYPQQQNTISSPSPVIEYYETRNTRYHLPALKMHVWVPVMAWTVYVAATEDIKTPIGPAGQVYRVLHVFNNPILSSGYNSFDSGF